MKLFKPKVKLKKSIMDKIKETTGKVDIRGKIKETAKAMVFTGYMAGAAQLIDKSYAKLYEHCDKVLLGKIEIGDHQYWKNTVLNKYFGKCIKGAPSSMVVSLREWLSGFWLRVRDKAITEDDRQIIREVFVPYMKKTHENAAVEYMKKMKMMG